MAQISSLVLLSLLLCLSAEGFRVDLVRVERRLGEQIFQLSRDHATSLASKKTCTSTGGPVRPGLGDFIMELFIGTPAVRFPAYVDTGSDLIWTQCQPCLQCFNQSIPIYDPMSSSSFSWLSCNASLCTSLYASKCIPYCEYSYGYADGITTRGVLSTETFTFGTANQVSISNIGFGCGNINTLDNLTSDHHSGWIGMGRGPLSLVSQLNLSEFSYCFTRYVESKSSVLFLGHQVHMNYNEKISAQSTPIIRNPSQESFYHLNLQGISIGETRLPIPKETFEIKKNGSGGMIIDSGTTFTILEEPAFQLVRNAFEHLMKLPLAGVSDSSALCSLGTHNSTVEFPQLIFHFEGADLELSAENYFVYDPSSETLCLAIVGSDSGSIFGNFMQQNMHVTYDLEAEKLFFNPARCDQL